MDIINLLELDGSNGFRLDGSSGQVSSAGDINGDGCTDAVISDYNHGLVRLLGTGCLPRLLGDGFE